MQSEDRNHEDVNWLSVIARSLVFICLDKANLREKSVGAQATFLENLGLPRKDAANMLNTTANSLHVLASLARKKKEVVMQNENSQLNGSPADNVGRQLERIANLLGLLATHGKPQVEQIAVLSGAGYTPSEIAQLVGTTPNTVSVALSQMRAARKRKKQKKGKRGS